MQGFVGNGDVVERRSGPKKIAKSGSWYGRDRRALRLECRQALAAAVCGRMTGKRRRDARFKSGRFMRTAVGVAAVQVGEDGEWLFYAGSR